MDTENTEWDLGWDSSLSQGKSDCYLIILPLEKALHFTFSTNSSWVEGCLVLCAETEIFWASFQHAGDQHTLIRSTLHYEYSVILNFWS